MNNPIGIFDSGIGGLTVLYEAQKLLPQENFIYFSDNKNIPYGDKSSGQVKNLVSKGIKFLANKNVKTMIVACNTATSVAINDLRSGFNLPIVAMEPAVKPAVAGSAGKKVLVLATPITLRENKFKNLIKRLDIEKELIIASAPGLAELIENHLIVCYNHFVYSEKIHKYLENLLKKHDFSNISSVVLGCTHYVFLRPYLKKIIPINIKVIDGNKGTVKQLQRILKAKELLNSSKSPGKIDFFTSDLTFSNWREICQGIMKNYISKK